MTVPRRLFVAVFALLPLACGGCGEIKPEAEEPEEAEAPAEGPIAEADAFIAANKASGRIDTAKHNWKTTLPKPPTFKFPEGKEVRWILSTSHGRMEGRLFPQVAPIHVSSFIYLSRLKFFDGLTFHRIIQGFMAQGGDPVGNGSGWPGYSLPLEVRPEVRHDRRGILSTANSGAPNSDGSQFFIRFDRRPQLDRGYTIFGELVDGLDALDRIEKAGAPRNSGEAGTPRERVVIKRARVALR